MAMNKAAGKWRWLFFFCLLCNLV